MGAAYDFTIIHQRPPDRPTVLQRMDFPSRPYRVIFITFSVYFPISSEEFKTCLFAHLTLQWIDIPIVAWQQFNGIIPLVLESLIRCWQNAPCTKEIDFRHEDGGEGLISQLYTCACWAALKKDHIPHTHTQQLLLKQQRHKKRKQS